jgi:hypothetical protein
MHSPFCDRITGKDRRIIYRCIVLFVLLPPAGRNFRFCFLLIVIRNIQLNFLLSLRFGLLENVLVVSELRCVLVWRYCFASLVMSY